MPTRNTSMSKSSCRISRRFRCRGVHALSLEKGSKARFTVHLHLGGTLGHQWRKQGSAMLGPRGKAGDQNSTGDRTSAQHDALLVRRVVSGETRAFEDLYRIYHPRLTRFLINILRRPHLVEEALDDTMMVVWRRPDSFTGASKVSTWIFAIAYRTALKALSRLDEPQEDLDAHHRP